MSSRKATPNCQQSSGGRHVGRQQRQITACLLAISLGFNVRFLWDRFRMEAPDLVPLQAALVRQNFQMSSAVSLGNSTARLVHGSSSAALTDRQPAAGAGKRLEFVHIPKTAGTAIEIAALEQGITWGYQHFSVLLPNGHRKNSDETVSFRKTYGGFPWHIPPCLLSRHNQNIIAKNPYLDGTNNNEMENRMDPMVNLFAVVRNPYDRAVSEYRYYKMLIRGHSGGVYQMNRFVASKLQIVDAGIQHKLSQISSSPDSCELKSYNTDYFLDKGHYIPQYDYVYQTNHITNQTTIMIQHVLKYENLLQDFGILMKVYGLEHIKLSASKEHRTHQNRPDQQQVTKDDLSPENIQNINRIYHKDFLAFGYQMRQPTMD